MTQSLNQFKQSVEKGLLDLEPNELFSGQIDPASVADFTEANAFAVKITDTAGKVITFDLATANTDDVFGFLPFAVRTNNYSAGSPVGVVSFGGVMHMEASAAIARGALLEIVPTGNKVVTQSGGTVIGRALDKASADGDLIRVLISTK